MEYFNKSNDRNMSPVDKAQGGAKCCYVKHLSQRELHFYGLRSPIPLSVHE